MVDSKVGWPVGELIYSCMFFADTADDYILPYQDYAHREGKRRGYTKIDRRAREVLDKNGDKTVRISWYGERNG